MNPTTTLIAVDPGASGAIAWLMPDGHSEVRNMPDTPRDVWDLILSIKESSPQGVRAYMEKVGGFVPGPTASLTPMIPGSAMFNFGRGFGQLEGIFYGAKIPFTLLIPHTWQRKLMLGDRGLARPPAATPLTPTQKQGFMRINNRLKAAWKNKLKEVAQRLYPNLKVTLQNADALLILEAARRIETGEVIPATPPIAAGQPELLAP